MVAVAGKVAAVRGRQASSVDVVVVAPAAAVVAESRLYLSETKPSCNKCMPPAKAACWSQARYAQDECEPLRALHAQRVVLH